MQTVKYKMYPKQNLLRTYLQLQLQFTCPRVRAVFNNLLKFGAPLAVKYWLSNRKVKSRLGITVCGCHSGTLDRCSQKLLELKPFLNKRNVVLNCVARALKDPYRPNR